MDSVQGKITYNYAIYSNSPLVKYSIAYIFGILLGSYFKVSITFYILLSIGLLITAILSYFLFITLEPNHWNNFLKITLILSFISLGCLNIQIHQYSKIRGNKNILTEGEVLKYSCIIKEIPNKKTNSITIVVSVPESEESMILYIDKEFGKMNPSIGDTIYGKIVPRSINSENNNNSFYSKYLRKKGILYKSFLRSENITLTKPKKKSIKSDIYKLREKYIDAIFRRINSEKEASTLIAMTTGNKSFISSEIRSSFSGSGVMHILAVSGFHVGFIYTFFSFILYIFGNGYYVRIVRMIIVSLLLWFYASIAGFSPSITRAVIMLTIYEFCKITRRKKSALNTLAFCALLITIFEPTAIFDIGFQLSFVALLSIITIHPRIKHLYIPNNIVEGYVWSLISVSIACQIGTALISITVFGFFPTYFLLANLLVIPLSALILFLAASQIVFWNLNELSNLISTGLRTCVYFLNRVVEKIDALPHSKISVELNDGQILTLILMLILCLFEIIEDKVVLKYIYIGLIINFIVCSL